MRPSRVAFRLDVNGTLGRKLPARKGLGSARWLSSISCSTADGRREGDTASNRHARRRRCCAGPSVAFPTETVYGLGADATNGAAVAAIFAAKGRPRFNPLIVHVADLAAALALAELQRSARQLAAAFWPGPLTLVLPRAARLRRSPISPPPASIPLPCACRAPVAAGPAAGRERAHRRAERQPLGPCQPDHGCSMWRPISATACT